MALIRLSFELEPAKMADEEAVYDRQDQRTELTLAMEHFDEALTLAGNYDSPLLPGVYTKVLDCLIADKQPLTEKLNNSEILTRVWTESELRFKESATFFVGLIDQILNLDDQ